MNRFAVLLACLAATASNVCLAAPAAEDPAFCKSMCASEQNACRADARLQPKEERFGASDFPDRNPFARTAQQQVGRTDQRALDAAGDQGRKSRRLGSCDGAWQRCTQGCSARATAPALAPARAGMPGVK